MNTVEITCGICGAMMDNVDEAVDNVVRCGFCGHKTVIPKVNQTNEVLDLLNAARRELSLCKFDDAYELYRQAAEKDKTEPEAYFGMAIAKFKIQYLRDYKNDRPLPICYAIAKKEICKDKNFLKALALSYGEQKKEYEERGRDIDSVMECFREYERQGINYDIFICTKVTEDESKRKTTDSDIAHDVYDILRKNGYKPFYSERDVDKLIGVKYEALILYALYRSKSMLVVCTDEHYLYNSANTTITGDNQYACERTDDYVFPLSYKDVTSGEFGFVNKNKLRKQITDYAKCQGVLMERWKSGCKGCGSWLLRSPYYVDGRGINCVGSDGGIICEYVHSARSGVCPALNIALTRV